VNEIKGNVDIHTAVVLLCNEIVEKQICREMIEKYSVMNLHTLTRHHHAEIQHCHIYKHKHTSLIARFNQTEVDK